MKLIEEALINNNEILYKIALKYLKNHDDVLDALQETAYKVIKNSNTIKKQEYILTWIIRILINTCLQMLNKNKHFSMVEFDETAYYVNSVEMNSDIEISEILLNINKNYRDVIVMKYIEGYKIREIAESYKKPESTIKTWLRRGLEALGSEVKSYE